MKSWYVPENLTISTFNPFIPLSIELVPSSNWENNVRSQYKNEWDNIRRKTYRETNYCCEICGAKGETHPVEAHEVWGYDIKNCIQKLLGIIALCPSCHRCCHIGLAFVNGQEEVMKRHIIEVNRWKKEDLEKYLNEVFYIFEERSKVQWTLDLSILLALD